MFSKEYVIRQIDLLLAYGITDIEITGGEPSECSNLGFYCQYIKNKLPTSKIAIITNGGLYKCDDVVWNNIDEVLVSYHISKNSTFIDNKMFPLGHTYDKVKKTIGKAKLLNKLIRTNTVIGTFNIDQLDYIVNDLIQFNPLIINFLPINLFDDANDMEQYINYIKLRPIIKNIINKLKTQLPLSSIYVRYMPFCNMEGYEQHIIGSLQHMYDWFDWNPELCGCYLIKYLEKYKTNDEILQYLGKYGSRSLERTYDSIKSHYEKNSKCLKCKYYIICDGVEKTRNRLLLNSIQPFYGKIIKNPMHFINTKIYDLYHKFYIN